jgi:hypothetical protein
MLVAEGEGDELVLDAGGDGAMEGRGGGSGGEVASELDEMD